MITTAQETDMNVYDCMLSSAGVQVHTTEWCTLLTSYYTLVLEVSRGAFIIQTVGTTKGGYFSRVILNRLV
jgi:hypothetical protein